MERILLARGKVSDTVSKHSVGVSSAERVVKGCEFHNSGLGRGTQWDTAPALVIPHSPRECPEGPIVQLYS